MTDLSGKTVLLTGALGSLGRAQSEAIVAAGASLVLLDRPGHAEAAGFVAGLGAKARYLGQDLNDLAGTRRAAETLAAEVGGIDVLINNAALIINRPFEAFSIE